MFTTVCTCLFIHVLYMSLEIFLIGTCKKTCLLYGNSVRLPTSNVSAASKKFMVLYYHCHKQMLTTKCLFATNTPIANMLLTRHKGFCQMALSHWIILSMHCSKPFPNFCMLNLCYCNSCFETRKSATINYSHLSCEPHTCKVIMLTCALTTTLH